MYTQSQSTVVPKVALSNLTVYRVRVHWVYMMLCARKYSLPFE